MDRTPVIDARNRQIRLMKTQGNLQSRRDGSKSLHAHVAQHRDLDDFPRYFWLLKAMSPRNRIFSETILGKSIEMLLLALDPEQSKLVGTPSEMLVAQGG